MSYAFEPPLCTTCKKIIDDEIFMARDEKHCSTTCRPGIDGFHEQQNIKSNYKITQMLVIFNQKIRMCWGALVGCFSIKLRHLDQHETVVI